MTQVKLLNSLTALELVTLCKPLMSVIRFSQAICICTIAVLDEVSTAILGGVAAENCEFTGAGLLASCAMRCWPFQMVTLYFWFFLYDAINFDIIKLTLQFSASASSLSFLKFEFEILLSKILTFPSFHWRTPRSSRINFSG